MLMALIGFCLTAFAAHAPDAEDGPRRILCFGDSNTAGHPLKREQAWPAHLQGLLKGTVAINAGVSSRTVGQEKGDQNALEAIDDTLKKSGRLDEVIVMLGTNDTKGYNWNAGGGAAGVARRLSRLIDKVMLHQDEEGRPPRLTVVTPPPMAARMAPWADKPDMFQGGNERAAALVPLYRELALRNRARFIDLHAAMQKEIDALADPDGIHFTADGQKRIAEIIAGVLNDRESPEPVAGVELQGRELTWKPSPSADVVGYEVYDGKTFLFATAQTKVTLPEGHETKLIRARDAAGNVSSAP